ncbi:Structural maintenance of chromosomes protein 6 [Lonchura striata]|uniref:Structural maintenance of chromosomes protein 6 n=1 Tax=Lonchura striata TaxID=40157 RepID=A0A218VCN4_9PASE|nr:structural maintenance of chromosomes protein 6 [Lonchura striata domestica]OWK63342.1 Structural maintenance of chromosomes protein 6 [Lonchura striata domestica]
MGKRKEESVLTPGSQKRQRKENTDVHNDESNEEETLQFSPNSSAPSQLPDGEVGIIESIQLKNFMCHSNLGPFQFGSNLNFVIGTNGSGKSSVLTALIVGLGGKATATNRGSSLKMFIQKGETSADISITLRNQGRDAFKPELYGTSITVNQRINQDGSRTCKLKSKSGTIISSKKEELIGMLDHFNIQVDNPVSVLTQEMSKQFLQTKNEGDKYKFFLKVTQLEQMKEDYSFIGKTKTNTRVQIEQGEERLEELKQLYLEKKEIFKSIAFVNDMQNRLKDLKHQMAWAVVSEMEKEIELLKEGIKAEEENTELLQKVEECQVKVNEAEKKYKAIQDKLITVSEEAQALHPQCISLKAEVQAKRKTVNETEIVYNRSKTELKRLGKDSEQLHKRIEELKSCANQDSEPEKLERQRRIAHLREQLKAFHNEEIMIGQQLDQFQQAISKCREEHSRLRRESSEVQQALDAQQKQLRDLKDSKTNALKRFGPHVPAFLEAVEVAHKRGQFRKKPLGPLGALIHPKDPELILAIESCLKGLLQAFCCDNHSDERTLQLLMSKYYKRGHRPQIIVNKFQNRVYDTSQRGVYHPEFPSVLTALEIDNPVVANCLIDMRGIERVLLIKNNRRAREVMQHNRPPRNCREAFTAEGDQVFERRYYSSSSARPQLLSQDVEAEISHLDSEIENKRAQLTASQQRLRSIENEIRQNEDHLYGHQRHQKQLQVKVRTANAEIADLENMEEHQSADIHILQEEAEENKARMESVKQDMQLQSRKVEELKNTLQAAEKKLEEVKEKIHQVEEIAGPIKAELNQAESEVENSKRHLQHYEDKQREHVACINKHKDLLVSKEKELEEKMAKARQIFPEPIKVSRTVKSLDAEMNRLREKINLESSHRGNREEIIQQFHYAKERYEDASNKVKNLRRFIAVLDEVMTERLKVYRQFLRKLSMHCKLHFEQLLRLRGYSGHIMFDHKNETISITVQPREDEKTGRSDLKSLSGGERSFSTVCFILSLWNISESPFRCMDEFDVYMDMVNRRIAVDMILERADFQRHRQFILFTPLSMSSLPTSPHIRILRMPDPPKDQRTLNFQNRNDGDEDQ